MPASSSLRISTIRSTIFQLQPRRHDPAGLQTRILGITEAHTDQLGYRPQLRFTGPLDSVVDEPLAADILRNLVRPVVVRRSKGTGLVGEFVHAPGESCSCATPTDLCHQRV